MIKEGNRKLQTNCVHKLLQIAQESFSNSFLLWRSSDELLVSIHIFQSFK